MKGRRRTRRLHPEGLRYFLRVRGYSCPDGHDPTKCNGCLSVREHLLEQEQAFNKAWREWLRGFALGRFNDRQVGVSLIAPREKRKLLRVFRGAWRRAIVAVGECDELTYCALDPQQSYRIVDGHMQDAHGLCASMCSQCHPKTEDRQHGEGGLVE